MKSVILFLENVDLRRLLRQEDQLSRLATKWMKEKPKTGFFPERKKRK